MHQSKSRRGSSSPERRRKTAAAAASTSAPMDMSRAEKIAKAMAMSRPSLDGLDTVLFLDVDGVLHPSQTRSHIQFCAECLQSLKAIVADCNPVIVLSSAWRTDPSGRNKLSVQLALHGIPTFKDWTKHLPGNPEEQRPKEILDWVRTHQPSTWVAIDDWPLGMNEKTMRRHFFQTDGRQGLTMQGAARVAELLAAQRGSQARQKADVDQACK